MIAEVALSNAPQGQKDALYQFVNMFADALSKCYAGNKEEIARLDATGRDGLHLYGMAVTESLCKAIRKGR